MSTQENRATINDVARLAGVSKRTVSRVINGSADVGAATRERIEAVIRETGYSPDPRARGLASQRSYLLGLIYSNPTMFIDDVQRGILSVCKQLGYELVVHPCDMAVNDPVEEINAFISRSKIDGVILLPPVSEKAEVIAKLKEMGSNYMLFTSGTEDDPWRQIISDYRESVAAMVDHLVAHGHRRFGYLAGPRGNLSSRMRLQSFREALASHGFELAPEHIIDGAFTATAGEQGARPLLQSKTAPTAIFAANDEIAIGAIRTALELGLKVPEDVSFVGVDGTWLASHFIPSLSTIERPIRPMAELATRKLLAFIDGGQSAAEKLDTVVVPEFIARESSGPAPG